VKPASITIDDVAASLGRHLDFYKHKTPHYQTTMLRSLRSIWMEHHERVLDIGGGTGVIGQCIAELFPVGSVEAIDVVDRFCKTLAIPTRLFDGRTLPFSHGSFDAATINNVVHHISIDERIPLFREIRRVLRGPLYIKDHEARSRLDHMRLSLLDLIGNAPFGGMVRAKYLSEADWRDLARNSGFRIAETASANYRAGVFASVFPNRMEIVMRWEPI
jgi:SAM-dependent methyltransferase